jgi:hypothetical protein
VSKLQYLAILNLNFDFDIIDVEGAVKLGEGISKL